MALSEMSPREKTIVTILAVVIVVALIGIGILAYRLLTDGGRGQPEPGIAVTETAAGAATGPEPTVTLIAAPSLEGLSQVAGAPISNEPVVVMQAKAVGPLAPVLVASQPLAAGHRYRLEINADNGAKVPIHGNWGQSATSASGKVAAPQIEFFEGTTPYRVEIVAPVPDPSLWSMSASAGPKGIPAGSASLVLTIWDVTGVK